VDLRRLGAAVLLLLFVAALLLGAAHTGNGAHAAHGDCQTCLHARAVVPPVLEAPTDLLQCAAPRDTAAPPESDAPRLAPSPRAHAPRAPPVTV